MRSLVRFFKFVAVGSFSLVLMACYGVMYGVPYSIKDGRVIVHDQSGNPIPGLSINIFNSSTPNSIEVSDYTNEEGEADFQICTEPDNRFVLMVTDIDGDENLGEFATKEEVFVPADFPNQIDINIVVDEVE